MDLFIGTTCKKNGLFAVALPDYTENDLNDARIKADVCGPIGSHYAGVRVLTEGPTLYGIRAEVDKILAVLQ